MWQARLTAVLPFTHYEQSPETLAMPSKFDHLYFDLFGERLNREGEAFERLAAAVTKILGPSVGVEADARLRGLISQSLYQVDLLTTDAGGKTFGEAKDYSERGAKVGRPDLQKLAGALIDVDVKAAKFFSATDYTREAKRYAKVSTDLMGKPIELVHLRESVEQDEEGRIKKIVLTLHIVIPDMAKAQFKPVITEKGQRRAREWAAANNVERFEANLGLSEFYDEHGIRRATLAEVTAQGYGGDMEKAWASFWLPRHYIKVNDVLLELHGLEYLVPFKQRTQTLEVVASGKPTILIKSEDGKVDKLVTDEQLKAVKFSADGEVTLP